MARRVDDRSARRAALLRRIAAGMPELPLEPGMPLPAAGSEGGGRAAPCWRLRLPYALVPVGAGAAAALLGPAARLGQPFLAMAACALSLDRLARRLGGRR